jgi:hypothetical protein
MASIKSSIRHLQVGLQNSSRTTARWRWGQVRSNPRVHPSLAPIRYLQGPTQPDPAPNAVPVDHEPPPEPTQIPKGAWKGTAFKMAESALTTFASIAILG